MWLARGLILLAGAIGLVWLGTKNAGTKVTFHLFSRSYVDAELNLVLLVTFACGMILWAIGAWIREAQLLLNLMKERKTIRKLREELSDLRNLPLEEDSLDSDDLSR